VTGTARAADGMQVATRFFLCFTLNSPHKRFAIVYFILLFDFMILSNNYFVFDRKVPTARTLATFTIIQPERTRNPNGASFIFAVATISGPLFSIALLSTSDS
jgi:hypothetical protein